MELQDRLEELQSAGIGVAAISYDSEDTLAAFAERRGITFPLLSDDDSATIREYGILNTAVAEGLGPNGNDPAVVADVHKYVAAAVFDSPQLRRMINGTPFSLAVDVEPSPEMHIYAPGAEEKGYRVIGFNMAPSDFVRFEAVEFPQSEIYYFEPLDEYVPVYQEPFTLIQEAVVNASAETEDVMEEVNAITLSGTLDYQACDDAICYLPVSVPVSFTLEFQNLDYQRSSSR